MLKGTSSVIIAALTFLDMNVSNVQYIIVERCSRCGVCGSSCDGQAKLKNGAEDRDAALAERFSDLDSQIRARILCLFADLNDAKVKIQEHVKEVEALRQMHDSFRTDALDQLR